MPGEISENSILKIERYHHTLERELILDKNRLILNLGLDSNNGVSITSSVVK